MVTVSVGRSSPFLTSAPSSGGCCDQCPSLWRVWQLVLTATDIITPHQMANINWEWKWKLYLHNVNDSNNDLDHYKGTVFFGLRLIQIYKALKTGSLFIKMCDQTPYFHYCQHRICIHLLGSYYWNIIIIVHYTSNVSCPRPKQIYFIYPHWKLCGRFNISSILCRQRLITIYFSVQKFPNLINHENMEVSNFYFISAKSFPHLTFLWEIVQ